MTREKIRAFVLAGREEPARAIGLVTPPPVAEVALPVEPAPAESASEAEAYKIENKGNR